VTCDETTNTNTNTNTNTTTNAATAASQSRTAAAVAVVDYQSGTRTENGIMLVLSRQRDESIIIGDNIVITIVDIRGDKVRLGIQAPTEISVHRQEVYEAIQRDNLRAAGLDSDGK